MKAFVKRLGDAAYSFWPWSQKAEREDAVSNTVMEMLSRRERGEAHTTSWWAKHMWGRTTTRMVRGNREFTCEDMEEWAPITLPRQESFTLACEMIRLVGRLPKVHRDVLALRIDGANAAEIAVELRMPITRVLDVLKEARLWLDDGGAYLAGNFESSPRTKEKDPREPIILGGPSSQGQ